MEEDNTFEGGVLLLEGVDTGTDIASNNPTDTQTIVPVTVCGGDTRTQPDTTSSVCEQTCHEYTKNFLFHPNNECTQENLESRLLLLQKWGWMVKL